VVGFYYNPGDPSIFDDVQFYDQSYDPAGLGIATRSWSFGDGASATGCCPTHRYAADGTYTLTLTVTTPDGRSASSSRDLLVRTHDVGVAGVLVPQTAIVGQTGTITVALRNSRYPETVQVQLLKSIAGGGWQPVGVLMQHVPVRGDTSTTNFDFSYRFAREDAQLGRVSFRAVATIRGARDALSSDNTSISALVLVQKGNGRRQA
jgi:PKD domain